MNHSLTKDDTIDREELLASLLNVAKQDLIDSAIYSWCNYGTAINKKFKLGSFFIVGYPMQEMLEEATKEKIVAFTMYINDQREKLDNYR